MPNLYTTVAHFSKEIDGITVHFMRLKDNFGFCFVKNGKLYGNFVSPKSLSMKKIDELVTLLEGNAEQVIKKNA